MTLIPILLYHSIAANPASVVRGFAIDAAVFAEHLDLIVARGLTPLTVGAFVDACERRDDAMLSRSVLITFDDGFADFASAALPALADRHIPATLFVATGLLRGQSSPAPDVARLMMSRSQLPALHEQGVEIGCHSYSHPHLDTLGMTRLRAEVTRSKAELEDALGDRVDAFAYPHGYSGPRVRRVVRESGFRSACAVKNAFSSPTDDRFALARLTVRTDTPTAQVARWLDRRGALPPPRRDAPRTRAWRAYRRSRSVITRRAGADAGWPAGRP